MSEHQVAPKSVSDAVDRSLGLTLISIRLPAAMIEDYKMVAKLRGMLYQPLMREPVAAFRRRFGTTGSPSKVSTKWSALRTCRRSGEIRYRGDSRWPMTK